MSLDTLFGAPVSVVGMHMLEMAAADEIERNRRIAERWDAYHGRHKLPLKVIPGKVDDNVVINYARMIVDKGVSFLFGDDIGFDLVEGERTPQEAWLDDLWAANKKITTLQKLAMNGAVCGHTYAKIVPAKNGAKFPRVVVIDPATVSVLWEPDDIDTVIRYRIQYPAIDPIDGKPIVIRQDVVRDGTAWRIVDQKAKESRDEKFWRITDQKAKEPHDFKTVAETPWPYPWPPVVDCQNLPMPNEYWGMSDLEDDVLQLNASINRVMSNMARIIRFHAHPKTWGTGFTSDKLRVAVDETIVLPTGATLANLEMSSDLASSLSLFERLRESLHEISRVPEVATGKMDRVGALSGVALNILYQPLLEKTQTKRHLYGDLLVELNRRLLALGGYGDDLRTTLHWPELLPGDPLQERQVALIDQQLGVSTDTILRGLGHDPEDERDKRNDEAEQRAETAARTYERGGLTDAA